VEALLEKTNRYYGVVLTAWRHSRILLAVLIASSACQENTGARFSFALLGDNPYGADFVPRFEALIDHVNATSPAWVIHVGDVKGTEPCSNELLESRFHLFQRFGAPFILTPGDNDWYDCREERMGSFDPDDRLALLRRLFFADPPPILAGSSAVERQSEVMSQFDEYVENVMWVRDGVVFATVHLVVTAPPLPDSARAQRRLEAALAWMDRVFAVASDLGAAGIFFATQADPWFASGLPFVLETLLSCRRCLAPAPGLAALYPFLVAHVKSFARPVVLAVGDTHVFRVDKPLYDPATRLMVENFTRVETFGHPDVHWVKVTVDTTAAFVFSFDQELVPANIR